ncbi:Hypothetical protein A7982_05640 [Minicystis rosea]|nr:Hypothetical protein A7982_05640 [Minicystis rosea]
MGMSKRRGKAQETPSHGGLPQAVMESGVLPVGLTDQIDPDRAPPWPIVHAYLTTGEHCLWVEGWAARSPAFAEVLAALRNDHEERTSAAKPVAPRSKR